MLRMAALCAGRSTPKAELRAGERPEICWPLVLTSFGAFGLLATGLSALPVSFASVATTAVLKGVLMGVFVLITLPVLLGWARQSRPRAFNPDTDLEEVVAIR